MSTRLNKHKMCTKGSLIFLNHVHSPWLLVGVTVTVSLIAIGRASGPGDPCAALPAATESVQAAVPGRASGTAREVTAPEVVLVVPRTRLHNTHTHTHTYIIL